MLSWKFWRFWTRSEFVEAGERARREHARWLTDALSSNRPYPKIPLRAVRDGGFGPLLARSGGEELARSWWGAAFNRVDRIEGRDPAGR